MNPEGHHKCARRWSIADARQFPATAAVEQLPQTRIVFSKEHVFPATSTRASLDSATIQSLDYFNTSELFSSLNDADGSGCNKHSFPEIKWCEDDTADSSAPPKRVDTGESNHHAPPKIGVAPHHHHQVWSRHHPTISAPGGLANGGAFNVRQYT